MIAQTIPQDFLSNKGLARYLNDYSRTASDLGKGKKSPQRVVLLIIKTSYMKEKRFARYLQKRRQPGQAIDTKESVKTNPDNHIDQDFPGFPHGNASEELINPVSTDEKKVSRADKSAKENRVQP